MGGYRQTGLRIMRRNWILRISTDWRCYAAGTTAALPSNTIVFHTAISQDAAGERFVIQLSLYPWCLVPANAPVFVMDDVDFSEGAVGGTGEWADNGRAAAAMALRILNGEKPQDIPLQ